MDYLNVWTKCSACPFIAGWWGADGMCFKPLPLRKHWNLLPSERTAIVTYKPLLAFTTVGVAVAFLSIKISGYFEWASTTMRNVIQKWPLPCVDRCWPLLTTWAWPARSCLRYLFIYLIEQWGNREREGDMQQRPQAGYEPWPLK